MVLKLVGLPGREAGTVNGFEVAGEGAQCPNCSRVYDEYDYENGKETPFPSNCLRCGCTMQHGIEAVEFANDRANNEQQDWPKPQAKAGTLDDFSAEQIEAYIKTKGYNASKKK